MGSSILTLNGGSSSIKFALFAPGDPPTRQTSGKIERIGQGAATLTAKSADGAAESPQPIAAPDPDTAATQLLDWLDARVGLSRIRRSVIASSMVAPSTQPRS